ncbi:MAG: response regulator transcription factor [Pleurocapsa sp.]
MAKILVIEDELSIRENIVDLLEAEEFEVFSTSNGILGILWAKENKPDLVICDVMMPEISGHEVLEEIREIPETMLTPFIFLTAMSDKEDIRNGMELGADDYLTKPFTRQELLNAIDSRLLRQAKLMKQYNDEHQRAKILEQRIKELEELQIQDEISQKYLEALLKINTAVNLIKKIKPGQKRDRNLRNIKENYTNEISLLKLIPNIEEIYARNQPLSMILHNSPE